MELWENSLQALSVQSDKCEDAKTNPFLCFLGQKMKLKRDFCLSSLFPK